MKNRPIVKIYLLSHPILHTEWLSLLGDKYQSSMPFEMELTSNFEDSNIVVLDGILTPKNNYYLKPILEKIKSDKILLLQGETRSMFTDHPFVKFLHLDDFKFVELPGFTALPEELLGALNDCFQKMPTHV